MKILLKISVILSILVATSCEEFFIGQQPDFISKSEFEPALNIFGVLRPDSLYGLPASFVIVGIIAPTTNDTSSNWFIFDAEVFLKGEAGNDTSTFFNQYDTLNQQAYYNYNFTLFELNSYQLICYKEGYDSVFATTTIPAKPVVNSCLYTGSEITIDLQNNASIYMYDIYLFVNNNSKYTRILPSPGSSNTLVSIQSSQKPAFIEVYSYDKNLADYYGSSNEFVKPNTYKEPFSSVAGGYGCFGSLNKSRIQVE